MAGNINPVRDTSVGWTVTNGTREFSPTFDLGGASFVGLRSFGVLTANIFSVWGNIDGGSTVVRVRGGTGATLFLVVGDDDIVLTESGTFIALRYIAFFPNAIQSGGDREMQLIVRPVSRV